MENRIYFSTISDLENLIKKIIGKSPKSIKLKINKDKQNKNHIKLQLNIGFEFDISVSLNLNEISNHLCTFTFSNDKPLMYISKLYLISKILNFYKFDEDTIFKLIMISKNNKEKTLKHGNYFECMKYFNENIYNDYERSLFIDFEEKYLGRIYLIKISDNKNNYIKTLVEVNKYDVKSYLQ